MSRSNNIFKKRLVELDLLHGTKDDPICLFFVAERQQAEPSVRIALEQAARFGADAVFFRQFPKEDNRSPLPQLYIYNRTDLSVNPSEFGKLQRRLWNADSVPLAAILTTGAVNLFSCRREPEYVDSEFVFRPLAALERVVEAEKEFLRRGIAGGTLWEDPQFADDFSFDGSAHKTLLEHLRHFKRELLRDKTIADDHLVTKLLVLAILLKYLEDRKDEKGNGVFPEGFFSEIAGSGCDSLHALFRKRGACVKLFDSLSKHFNGNIFTLLTDEHCQLEKVDLNPLADFLEGSTQPGGQQVFWPLYSFNDLPVELISNIYEEFLAQKDGGQGVVYTPHVLVEFLLDQCLPLEAESLDKKILDPACGSGIFLVGAFRRLVHCWRMKKDWRRPTHKELKNILRKNIFGVDIAPESVLVTAFSLCVALCDELDPKMIWEELRFDDLRKENLQNEDFFDVVEAKSFVGKFDLVIGNPPFDSKLNTKAAKSVEKDAAKHRPRLPDTQLALLFLDQAFTVCRSGGTVCLIQPAAPLLYNVKAREFRNYLFGRYDIQAVFDFTPLESVLFKADVAAAAILARKRDPKGDELLHMVFRRTRSSKDRLLLEADYYDFHWLGQEYVKNNPYAWKVDLLGGGRLHRLIERFANMPHLGPILVEKRREGWIHGEGFNVGCGSVPNAHIHPAELEFLSEAEVQRHFSLSVSIKRAEHLTGKLLIPPEAITLRGIDTDQYRPLKDVFFERDRKGVEQIFQPPHLLLREVVWGGHIPAVFSDKELVFSKQVYGIHAPSGQEDELKDMALRLSQSDLYAALLAATSSRYLISRSTSLLASDLMALPYPDRSELELAWWEEILVKDVVQMLVEFRQRGEKAAAIQKTTAGDLAAYGETYCRTLNTVYKEFRPLPTILVGGFVCYPFCYGKAPKIELPTEENVEAVLTGLCQKRQGPRLFINRIIRLYEQNVILMIKPNQKRFWLRSVALRDADETMAELIKAGY